MHTMVRCGRISSLEFTSQEIGSGLVNILDHMSELTAKDGTQISLVTFQNGVWNKDGDCENNFRGLMDQIPEDVLAIGIFKPTDNPVTDVTRAWQEQKGYDTVDAIHTRQILVAFAESLYKVNQDQKWLHVVHSRAGATGRQAIEGMTPEQQEMIKGSMIWLGIGPAAPLPVAYAYKATNYYSTKDAVTGTAGCIAHAGDLKGKNGRGHNIQFLEHYTGSPFKEHSFLGQTYTNARNETIRDIRRKGGFYIGDQKR